MITFVYSKIFEKNMPGGVLVCHQFEPNLTMDITNLLHDYFGVHPEIISTDTSIVQGSEETEIECAAQKLCNKKFPPREFGIYTMIYFE